MPEDARYLEDNTTGGIQIKGPWMKSNRRRCPRRSTSSAKQSRGTQPTWVGLGQVEPMGWTIFFITIIIKLSKKIYISHLPSKLINKIYINI